MDSVYKVIPVLHPHPILAEVVGSKSITNRALLLAAMSNGKVQLNNVLFSDDSRVFMQALVDLGFETTIDEENRVVTICGHGGSVPKKEASVYVGSAGTAARFLTAYLGLSKGRYLIDASEQMKKRPIKELLEALESIGSVVEFVEEPYHFPFYIGMGDSFSQNVSINIDKSSQFLSALLIIAPLFLDDMNIQIEGSHGLSYVEMTLSMMEQFGAKRYQMNEHKIQIPKGVSYKKEVYDIEPDLSAACYFYAMGAVLKVPAKVKGVYFNCLQGDIQFLSVLKEMGCSLSEEPDGILLTPGDLLYGGTFDLSSFSDQTLTLAAIAPFANSNVVISNVGHIRLQECDRINAILQNLSNMGICVSEENGTITIEPGEVKAACIETFDDHRVAMSFTIPGLTLKSDARMEILNPMCCRKTFETYFDCLEEYLY